MLALKQHLDIDRKSIPIADAAQIRADVQKLAAAVTADAKAALAKTDAAHQNRYRSIIVKTVLLAADLANREDKNPNLSLQLLQGFEDSVRGLPGETELLGDALFLRVDSYMDLKQNANATAALVELLKGQSANKGADITRNLLLRLDADLDAARAAGDVEQMRLLARSRAQLSRYLVEWAETNKDANIKRFTYQYRVFDAATQLQAAELEDDPARRKAVLEEALTKPCGARASRG